MGARLLLRLRRAARHAHGPRRRSSPPPTIVNDVGRAPARARCCASTARSATPARSPARSSATRADRADRDDQRARRASSPRAIPAPARFAGGHPAKRTFQAIRIAVNDELDQLDAALPLAWGVLCAERPICRDFLPLAGRPAREALPRRPRAGLHLPAGAPGLRLRSRRPRPSCSPPRRRADARRGRRQPPLGVRPAARRAQAQGGPPA